MPWNGLLATAALLCNAEEDLDFAEISAFLGQTGFIDAEEARIPKITLGLSDFSIEWIVRFRDGDPFPGLPDFPWESGLMRTVVPGVFGEIMLGWHLLREGTFPAQNIQIAYDIPGSALGTFRFVSWPGAQSDFLHVLVNYDRDGLMSIWANGVQDVPSLYDISPDVNLSIPALGVYPLTTETSSLSDWDALTNDLVDVNPNKIMMTGFAIHKRLLTSTEIALNAANFKLGLYDETLVRYDMTKLLDYRGIEVTSDIAQQERLKSNIGMGGKWAVPAPWSDHVFGVIAPDGTIFLEDSSGNDVHYSIVTRESYGHASLSERVRTAFAGPPGAGP